MQHETMMSAVEAMVDPHGRAVFKLLEEAIEDWKEAAIGQPMETVMGYHGAIQHLRTLIGQVEVNTRPHVKPQPFGGYS